MRRCKDWSVLVITVLCLVSFLGFNTLAPVTASAADEKPAAAAKKSTKKHAKKKRKGPAPTFRQAERVEVLAKKGSLPLVGTGFKPGEEIRILFTDTDGMQSDIGYALKPELEVDKAGNFFTVWDYSRFIKAKLVKPGIFTMTVTDPQFKPLAETHVVFVAGEKKKKDKKGGKDKGEKKKK